MSSIKIFVAFQKIIAGVCVLIPLVLWYTDTGSEFRPSISNYVYMPHSYVFGMMLTMGAMLFIFNGALYWNTSDDMGVSDHGKWYNAVLGFALLLVICFPHLQYPIPHYIFACTFFVGNALVTLVFHRKADAFGSIAIGSLTMLSFVLVFTHTVSLLVAEWVSLTCIAGHFIMQSNTDKL